MIKKEVGDLASASAANDANFLGGLDFE